MKKHFTIVVFLMLGAFMAQSQSEVNFCNYKKVGTTNILDMCRYLKSENDSKEEIYIKSILSKVGLQQNFVLMECASLGNAASINVNTLTSTYRYIIFDKSFITQLTEGETLNWDALSILAHEIGHHLNGHTLNSLSNWNNELEADEFSGFIMAKLGGSLEQALLAVKMYASEFSSLTHPEKEKRIEAITRGYYKISTYATPLNAKNDLQIALQQSGNNIIGFPKEVYLRCEKWEKYEINPTTRDNKKVRQKLGLNYINFAAAKTNNLTKDDILFSIDQFSFAIGTLLPIAEDADLLFAAYCGRSQIRLASGDFIGAKKDLARASSVGLQNSSTFKVIESIQRVILEKEKNGF